MTKKIESISLDFPNSDCGEVLWYKVGKPWHHEGKIVTEIKKCERYGEQSMIPYYEIHTEDGVVAEMHQFGHIVYESN